MDKQLIAGFEKQLLAQRESLLQQIDALRGGPISRAEAAANHFARSEDSPAQVNVERELEFALGEREAAELATINAALQRIEAGDYGQCTDCGLEIPPARLHAAPEAPRCVSCQDKSEHRHGGPPVA